MQRRAASLVLAGMFLAFLLFLQFAPAAEAGTLPSIDRAIAHPFTASAGTPTVAAGNGSRPEGSCASAITVKSANDSGLRTLREALAQICEDGTIDFDATTMAGATITLASELVIDKGLTIDGLASSPGVTISGGGVTRVFNITLDTGTVNLNRLTIANGSVQTDDCAGASGYCGGGIMVQQTGVTLSVTNSTLLQNSATFGAGIFSEATLLAENTTFSGNSAFHGGGLKAQGAVATVKDCTFSGNSATAGGGLYANLGAKLTVQNSTFSGNSAGYGGGIMNEYTTLKLSNTVIANSTGGDCDSFSAVDTNDHNLIESTDADACGIVNGDGGTITGVDPLLSPLGDYGGPAQTLALLPGSRALDAGNDTTCLEKDQRGQARAGAHCDIGSFESQGFALAVSGGNNQNAVIGTTFGVPLGLSVTANNANEPVNGGQVTFSPPDSGPSATITGSPATISAGAASVTAAANGVVGAYNVSASVSGASDASFSLANLCLGPAITVTSADDSGPGTLRQALADLCADGTIDFDATTMTGATITLASELVVDKGLTIDGLATSPGVTVSGNHVTRVFNVTPDSGTVNFNRLTITGGNVQTTDCGASIDKCGSGMMVQRNGVTVNITDSTFSGNACDEGSGGGIYTWGKLTLENSTFSGNSAFRGGAIYNYGYPLTVRNSTFSGNASPGGAGGIANVGTALVENSTFSGNSGWTGGAIHNGSDTLTVRNSTFSGNSAFPGGAIRNDYGTLNLSNTLMANNLSGDCSNFAGAIGTNDHNLIEGSGDSACGITDGSGGSIIGQDPRLAPLGDYGGPTQTFALLPGSPALDAGNDATCLVQDQRGKVRAGAHSDIGSFEVQGYTLTPTGGDGQTAPIHTPFTDPLEVTLTETGGSTLPGVEITFTPPASGASAVLSSSTATTDADGKASVTATANEVMGGPYNVVASAGGSADANVSLTNLCAVITVASADDSGPDTLRQAIADICAGGTIEFDANTMAGATITLASELVVDKGLTINGLPEPDGVTVSGGGVTRVFNVTAATGTVNFNRLTITGGNAGSGGGIMVQNTGVVVNVTNSTFSGNSAGEGGGIANYGTLTVENSTFSGNSAQSYGAGIDNHGTATVKNSTLSGNSAQIYGGGIANRMGILNLSNSVVANSSGGRDCYNYGTVATYEHNLVEGSATDKGGLPGGSDNIIGLDPLLAPLGDYGGPTKTFALLPGSPALDAGNDSTCLPKDQRGKPRAGTCDMGAFEVQGYTLDKTGGDGQATPISTPFANRLEVTLTETGGSALPGAVITFTPPASGQSATLSGTTATTDADGKASVTAAANDTAGAYTVSATTGALSADFELTNLPPCVSAGLVTAITGSAPGTASLDAIVLTASVTNSGPDAVPAGIPVQFTADGSEIGVAATTEALAAGASTTVSVEWVPPAGDLAIAVTPQPENAEPPLTLCTAPTPATETLSVFDRPLWDIWEQISFPVQPDNPAASSVVKSLGSHFLAVRSYDGSAQVYYPQLPPEFSTLQTMDAEHGYWIKTTALVPPPGWMENPPPEATLRVSGQRLAEDHPLALKAGWNLVSYLPRTSLDVRDALASIAGKYAAVSGWERGSQSYYPSQAWSWATLKVLKPGFGYWINMTEAATLTYPVTVGAPVAPAVDAATAEAARLAAVRQAEAAAGVAPSGTWADFAGYALQRDGTPYAAGTVLEALDPQGVVCGATVVGEGGAFGPLACYGDQADTAADEGAQPGDVIRVVAAGDAQVEVGRGVWTGPLGFQRIGKPAGKGPVLDGAPGDEVPAAN